jgi:hypothetical protein
MTVHHVVHLSRACWLAQILASLTGILSSDAFGTIGD